MRLEELRKIAAARTKGEWKWDEFGCTAPSQGHYSKARQKADNEFIATFANHADRLLAVCEAAKLVADRLDKLKPIVESGFFTITEEEGVIFKEVQTISDMLAALEAE